MAVEEFSYPSADEIHAQILADLRYNYARFGVTVNVQRDSELWHRSRAFARRLAVAIANGKLGLRRLSPLTAVGDELVALAKVFGVTARPAARAKGFIKVGVLSPATSITVSDGYECVAAATGTKYRVISATLVEHGDLVQVESVETGKSTDLAADKIVTWSSSEIGFLDQKATVASGGIDGGADADDQEALRARLLRRLGFPGVGGSWSHVAQWAEESSAAVEAAFVYPTMRGPASYDVAIVGEPADPVLNAATVKLAADKITEEHPGNVSLNVTSVAKDEIDVVINLGLPLPKHAGGAGGGWVDAAPWPSTAETGVGVYAKITAVDTAVRTITVDSTSADAPVAGKRVALWDDANEDGNGDPDPRFREFGIVSVAGSSGAYVLTLDAAGGSMAFIAVGMYASAAAENLQTYGELFREAMQRLGPGEKSSDTDVLFYARRKPGPDIERPFALTSRQLDEVTKGRQEISDMSFAARLATGTTTTRKEPTVPATSASAPKLLTLKRLAFRRQT